MTENLRLAIVGCLLGTAIGDALGLPYEGLTRDRQLVLYPNIDRQRLVFGKGMISDDTEHTCLVAQALIASAGNVLVVGFACGDWVCDVAGDRAVVAGVFSGKIRCVFGGEWASDAGGVVGRVLWRAA
jgi:hypothetical protein